MTKIIIFTKRYEVLNVSAQTPLKLRVQEVPDEVDWTGWTRPIVRSRDFSHYGWSFSATTATAAQIFNQTGL